MSAHSISKKNKWLSVVNYFDSDKATELLITGPIGESWWDTSGTSEKDFLDALKAIPEGQPITVGINSEGGAVKDGLGIYHALRRRGDSVTTRIDGYAVSIASVIALAGSRRISPESSIWMIHEPWSLVVGDSEAMRKEASALDTHAEAIASVYVERAGLTMEDARGKMKAETWFRGDAAVEMGFATETSGEPAALNTIDFTLFRNVPKDILRTTLAAVTKTDPLSQHQPVTVTAAPVSASEAGINTAPLQGGAEKNNKRTEVNKEQKLALLREWGVTVKPDATDAEIDALVAKGKPQATAPPAADPNADLMAKLDAIDARLNAIQNPPITQAPPRVLVVGDAYDQMLDAAPGLARRDFIRRAWTDIQKAAVKRGVWNVNTVSANLTTQLLSDTVITVLGNRLAPIRSFFTEQVLDPVKPKTTIQVPKVTGGATAQTDPTDWESGDSVVGATAITMHEYSVSFHVTNAELQSGTRIAWITGINAEVMADTILDVVFTPITEANFGTASVVSSDVAFTPSDLQTLWAAAKNLPIKNLILDGSYFARLIPTTTLMLSLSNGGPGYGYDSITYNNRWSAAGTNIKGCVTSPQALIVAAGLPIEPPGFNTAFAAVGSAAVPQIGFSVQTSSWIKPGTRVQWQAYDLMLGVAACDTSALKLIKSA